VNYAGWIPKVGIMPPPSRDRMGRPTSMILAHVVYGATLAAILKPALGSGGAPAAPQGKPRGVSLIGGGRSS